MKGFKIPSGRGFPGGRDTARLMKKMGVNLKGLEDVQEVIIKRESGDILIRRPEVSVMRFGDQEMFQITGEVSEVAETVEFTEDDVKIVSEQSGATIEEARKTLELMDGDLAKAIFQLKSEKGKSNAD